jgi:hypothetical protein
MNSAFYPTFLARKDTQGAPPNTEGDRKAIEETVAQLFQNGTTDQRPGVLLGKIQSPPTISRLTPPMREKSGGTYPSSCCSVSHAR